MSKQCEICGKATVTGRQLSHAHNVTPRTFEPNLRRVKALIDGAVRTVRVCARCLRSGRIQRPPARKAVLARLEAAPSKP
jgi:large subunit ribosomal protein L28